MHFADYIIPPDHAFGIDTPALQLLVGLARQTLAFETMCSMFHLIQRPRHATRAVRRGTPTPAFAARAMAQAGNPQ